jgi:hypothetical protein
MPTPRVTIDLRPGVGYNNAGGEVDHAQISPPWVLPPTGREPP